MCIETYSNTTVSALNTLMSADRVSFNANAMDVGDSASASGVRPLIGGGSRKVDYQIRRNTDDSGSRRYTFVRQSVEIA